MYTHYSMFLRPSGAAIADFKAMPEGGLPELPYVARACRLLRYHLSMGRPVFDAAHYTACETDVDSTLTALLLVRSEMDVHEWGCKASEIDACRRAEARALRGEAACTIARADA